MSRVKAPDNAEEKEQYYTLRMKKFLENKTGSSADLNSTLLSTYKSEPMKADNEDDAPLHTAAFEGNMDGITNLIKYGYDVNSLDPEELATPLHFAASNGQIEAMRLLIELGAEINIKNKEGKTPLFCAAGNGEIQAVKVLRELGGVMK